MRALESFMVVGILCLSFGALGFLAGGKVMQSTSTTPPVCVMELNDD